MPQETNLNVAPYFDDFDPSDNYFKILFKPGLPVQARELTGIQSILQDQIEKFGNHVFKEGSSVTGGGLKYNDAYPVVRVEREFAGVPVTSYLDDILDKTVVGAQSGVRAKIKAYLSLNAFPNDPYTLFVNYLDSSVDNENAVFLPSETLIIENSITNANVIIQSGEGIAKTPATMATTFGSGCELSSGVYFIRGYFVEIPKQSIILEPYSTTPSYKVGLEISEELINSDIDKSLTDNASSFNNFTAPGADRLKIRGFLTKRSVNSTFSPNFIELMEIHNGQIISQNINTEYNDLSDEFARRTFDESGDYFVIPFNVTVKETLNNYRGNKGIFDANQLTYNNNFPSENLATYKISPGKAYVRGYEIANTTNRFLDFSKPRTVRELKNQSLNYVTGPTFTLNTVHGSPTIGLGTSYTVSLRDDRIGLTSTTAAGKEIGLARVYDFALESGSYDALNPNTNEFDISLFDIQTYTEITSNTPLTLSTPTHIKGKSSGAVGYLRNSVTNSGIITAYNVKGKFVQGEQFIFNGIESGNIAAATTSFNSNDVKSIFGQVGAASTFNANVEQSVHSTIGQVNITGISTTLGISTVTNADPTKFFVGIATVGNLVEFTNPSLTIPSYAKIESVSQHSLTISGVTTVAGVNDGGLPTSSINPSDFKILESSFSTFGDQDSESLYTKITDHKVSNVDLTNANLTIRKEYTVTITNGSTNTINSGSGQETFLPYDEENYCLMRSDGALEALSSDKFVFSNGSQSLSINGLEGIGSAKLIATLRKINVKEKIKTKKNVTILSIDSSKNSQSGVGATTINDGLTFSSVYGTRVQDEEISLGVPDVTKIHAVYESKNAGDVVFPSLVLVSIDSASGKTNDLIVGEEITGLSSKFVGLYVEKANDSTVSYVSLNGVQPLAGEVLKFKESGIQATLASATFGSNDITNEFTFDNGQRDTIYDYSRLVRKPEFKEPVKKIKVVFESAFFSSSDTGDITTVNSYDDFSYCSLPKVNDIKVCEIIDIRPRVSDFSGTTRSPFEFLGRSFTQEGNSSANVLASDRSFLIDYSYYLARIDKIFLSKDGSFQLVEGNPSETPEMPNIINDAMEIATVNLPAYMCDVNEASLTLSDHKRYRMRDIRNLERRIKNLEFYTTLSLLESTTASLQIQDADGLNRFKSGFFVDDFANTDTQLKKTITKNSIDVKNSELRPAPFTNALDLELDPSTVGLRRSNNVLTLNFEEFVLIKQPHASRVENVTPYLVNYYSGTLNLVPSSDIWCDTIQLEVRNIENTTYTSSESTGSHSGLPGVTWGAWNTIWTGEDVQSTTVTDFIEYGSTQTTTTLNITPTGFKTRTGSSSVTRETFDTTSQGNKVISSDIIPYMRSRNIRFRASKLKPVTRLYAFLDSENLSSYIIPKLLQVSMVSGTFEKGESVIGRDASGNQLIKFRLCQSNHKKGNITSPSSTYGLSPYDRSTTIPEDYAATSTILNVDTVSLAAKANGEFHGFVTQGLRLTGQSSNAQATVSEVKLVSDVYGFAIGSIFIPDPNVTTNPRFETGMKIVRLTSSPSNSQVPGNVLTDATVEFEAKGTLSKNQETIVTTRNIHTETVTQTEQISLSGDTITSSIVNTNYDGIIDTGEEKKVVVFTDTDDQDFDDKAILDDNGNAVRDADGNIKFVQGGGVDIIISTIDLGDDDGDAATTDSIETFLDVQSTNATIKQFVETGVVDTDNDASTGITVFSPITPEELGYYNNDDLSNPNVVELEVVDGKQELVQKGIGGAVGTQTQEDRSEDIAGSFYVKYLGSQPDSQGLAYWTSEIERIAEESGDYDAAVQSVQDSFKGHPSVKALGVEASAAMGLQGQTLAAIAYDASLITTSTTSGVTFTDKGKEGEYTGSTDWDSEEISSTSDLNILKSAVVGKTYDKTTGQAANLDSYVQSQMALVSAGTINIIEAAANISNLSDAEIAAISGGQTTKACAAGDDPLAQSFFVSQPEGVFVTSIEVYFGSKDDTLPVTVQLRPMQLGLPTEKVYPFSEVSVLPEEIYVSDDASIATRISFESPVYLAGNTYHSVVLLSASNNYTAWISRMGDVDITTVNLPDSEQIMISEQPLLGSLFKSQNGSTWNPSQYEDLKFTLYKAKFISPTGTANLNNPNLSQGVEQFLPIDSNALEITSNKVRVGLGTTVTSTITLGNSISQLGSTGTGNFVGSAGSAFGTMTITNAGIGYTGNQTYTGVSLTNITGTGSNATANISIQNGVAIAATISVGGTGYSVGDVVTPTQIGSNTLGTNMRLSIGDLRGVNELIIDNIQGEFVTGVGKTLQFTNNSGVTADINGAGGNVLPTSIDTITDGLHVKVNHRNHGMHSTQNIVSIEGVASDVPTTNLTSDYDSSSTATITVNDASEFGTFEGVGVGTTTLGYLKVGGEIVSYSGTTATTITGITTRGVDGTNIVNHFSGDLVEKYELSGVSLRRINKTHNLSDATVSNPIGLDFYTIKIDNGTASGLPKLHFTETKSTGLDKVIPTENIPFEIVKPIIENITPNGTNLTAQIRTVSGKTIDGNEISFSDMGFEGISLDSDNYMSSPRIVASRVNETNFLTNLPNNKSFTLALNFATSNQNLSPVVDLDRIGAVFTSNRVNNPITNYATDPRTSTVINDPNAFVYASKPVTLELPATSIKVYITGHINLSSDIRAFFAISNDLDEDLIYNPFPGHNNLLSSGQVIDPANNDGLPDKALPKTDKIAYTSSQVVYKDYEFTIDNLPSFKHFSIKLVGSSTNSAQPPRVKDIRVIALA